MDGSNSIADDILRNGFERWQRLEGEKQAISDDLKELFSELKGQGFDGKALRASFRTVAKAGDADVEEHNALVDLYVGSLMAPKKSETGTVPATRTRAAREADPVAALRADPALAVVDAANLKSKSSMQIVHSARESLPGEAAGFTSEPVVTSPVESEFAAISTPITEHQPSQPAGSDLTASPTSSGQVAPHQPETATSSTEQRPAEAAHVASVADHENGEAGGRTRALPEGENLPVDTETDKSVEASASAAPASKYAAPGEVTWENHPPEGVERSSFSIAFGNMGQDPVLIQHDLEKGTAQPIVKMGKVIIDGWARYMVARNMRELDGQALSYPVVQYDGTDPLIDVIRWNVEGRTLDDHQKKLIAATLTRQNPARKDDIYRAFEIFLEPV